MEHSPATPPGKDALFSIKADYGMFFIFLSGFVFINAWVWIKNLPGKLPTALLSFVLLLLPMMYFFVVELNFYATSVVMKRPLFFGRTQSYPASAIKCVRVVNNTMTKSMTRVDVVFTKESGKWKIQQFAYKSEPRALYDLLRKNCAYPVELQLD